MNRAYALLTVKAVEEDQRVIRGVATTPRPDRLGDIVEPLGVKFRNPLPLLHQHDSRSPVGNVKFDKPTEDGITFEARLPKIEDPGPLKDRVDTAWGEVKAGLVRAVSIGFRAIETTFMDDGGLHFLKLEVLELSLVTVPANADAMIFETRSLDDDMLTTIKSFDREQLAATGRELPAGDALPGASGPKPDRAIRAVSIKPRNVGPPKMDIADQIRSFSSARAEKSDRMAALMEESGKKGETLDAEQIEEYDGLAEEVRQIDAHLKRLRDLERHKAATAKPVDEPKTQAEGSAVRGGGSVRVTGPMLPPGIRFARVARVRALARLDGKDVVRVAEELYGDDPAVVNVIRAPVPAGNTGNAGWAGNLVGDETSVFADFVEFLRPQTIVGRFGTGGVPSLRRVPFRTPLIGQTTGGSGYWVGEGLPKPLTKFDFARTTLDPLKVANIAVVTMEVLRDSSPSAEMIVRDSLAAALRERLDIDFIDPDKSSSSGVSPASITNAAVPIPSSGNDADSVRNDIRTLFGTFIAANNAPTSGVWIMSAAQALSLSLMMNPLGQSEFPGISMNGGTLFGLPVLVSEYVPTVTAGSLVILVNASDVYLGDDGGITVDMSREASLQMDDNPGTQTAITGTGTSLVSLWQTNSVGFRAERTISWALRRPSAVAVLSEVNWGLPTATV